MKHISDRVWVYNDPDSWAWRWWQVVTTGHDEYAHKTLVVRLPRRRALVWAWWTCTNPECQLDAAQSRQWDADVRWIADFYGVTGDEVIDLPDEAWDRALRARPAGPPWRLACTCPAWDCPVHGDPGMG